jgi:hypothetical protein
VTRRHTPEEPNPENGRQRYRSFCAKEMEMCLADFYFRSAVIKIDKFSAITMPSLCPAHPVNHPNNTLANLRFINF